MAHVEPGARRRAGRGAGAALRRLRVQARGGDPARQRARPVRRLARGHRRLGARRAHRAARDAAAAGGATPFLDGTVEPLRAGGHALGPAARVQEPGAVLSHATSSPHRRRPPTSWSRWRGRRSAEPAGHYALAYEAGAFFYHAAWLHGFGGRILDDARPARARRRTAPWRRWRSSQRSPPRSCLPRGVDRRRRHAAVQRRARGASPSTGRGSSARSRPACRSAWRRCRW